MTANRRESSAELWASLCRSAPTLQSARLDGGVVTSRWTIRDPVGGRLRQLRGVHVVESATGSILESPDEAIEFVSNSGRTRVRFAERDSKVEVSVWVSGGLRAVWKVQKKIHGAVFNDVWFGGVSFSPNEDRFIYVADRPLSTGESWIDEARGKFGARDVLGEQYVAKRAPALYLADIEQAKTVPLCPDVAGIPESENHDHFGDPQWSPDGRLVAVCRRPRPAVEKALEVDGVADNPYGLGVVYCYNRYSSVEVFRAPSSIEDAPTVLESLAPVSDHKELVDFCCYSPRFTPDSSTLVYLSAPRAAEGRIASLVAPHNTTKVLRVVKVKLEDGDVIAEAPKIVIGIVQLPKTPTSFPGLYLHALPRRPWFQESGELLCVMSTLWGSEFRVIGVPISSEIAIVEPETVRDRTPSFDIRTKFSVELLDVCGADAVFRVSSPLDPHALVVSSPTSNAIPIYLTTPSTRVIEAIRSSFVVDLVGIDCGVVDASKCAKLYEAGIDDPALRYQATLLVPRAADEGKVALCVLPHGGPHSACVNSYSTAAASMLISGIAMLYVNYRGSTGQGQLPLESLPGHAGTQDVAEVLQATRWALSFEPSLDSNRVAYAGGSHGGFLGCHVSAVAGSPFKAIALRNPVVNIASMVGVTDIPEWTFCESGAIAREGLAPSPEALRIMFDASPVARIARREQKPGKTILFVGGSDRRVPPEQSIEWHRAVTDAFGAGIVEMRWYEKSAHPISEVPEGDDVWVHTLELFQSM